MRKGLTLIELIVALTVGILVFDLLFSGNLEVTKAMQSSFQEAKGIVNKTTLQSWVYRNVSGAKSGFTNRYLGKVNDGFCSWKDAASQVQTIYLYNHNSYSDFAEAKFSRIEEYPLVYFEGAFNHSTYGNGVVLADRVSLIAGEKLLRYKNKKGNFMGKIAGRTLNMSVRVKN